MARKKNRKTSIYSYIAVALITVVFVCTIAAVNISLKSRNAEYEAKEQAISRQIEEERIRNGELKEKLDYVQSDYYIQGIAGRDYGLVKEGDTLVKGK
ncbi:MAG: hypothetical protein IJM37_03140 [Lachnospiraceae bacterium]|nr:hypothetical protein [Lachnospiraceae bacterium]